MVQGLEMIHQIRVDSFDLNLLIHRIVHQEILGHKSLVESVCLQVNILEHLRSYSFLSLVDVFSIRIDFNTSSCYVEQEESKFVEMISKAQRNHCKGQ